MALQKSLVYKAISLDAAYLRVMCPTVNPDKATMSFGLWVYPSQAAAEDASNMLTEAAVTYANVPYAMTGANIFQQAYDYLKALPEFAGATDVLEVGQPQA